MKNKLYQFLNAQNFTPGEVDNLNFILNKISDFEVQTGNEFEEEEAINCAMEYRTHYKKTQSSPVAWTKKDYINYSKNKSKTN